MTEYEVWVDPCYYDLWAVRKAGVGRWDETLHFPTKAEAIEWVEKSGGKVKC